MVLAATCACGESPTLLEGRIESRRGSETKSRTPPPIVRTRHFSRKLLGYHNSEVSQRTKVARGTGAHRAHG